MVSNENNDEPMLVDSDSESSSEEEKSIKYLMTQLFKAEMKRNTNEKGKIMIKILQLYLEKKNYTAMAKFVEKVIFPENASGNDFAKYCYYMGRIETIKLDYTKAYDFFEKALEKGPQKKALGFRKTVQKWLIVITLLRGQIPDRSIFRSTRRGEVLYPYLKLAQFVCLGDIVQFNAVLTEFYENFKKDETPISHLGQIVTKSALSRIAKTYSRIYLRDIGEKLHLSSEIIAEYIVTKAIKEGAIEGLIIQNSSNQRYFQSRKSANVYKTIDPQFEFNYRIETCLQMNNDAIKAHSIILEKVKA